MRSAQKLHNRQEETPQNLWDIIDFVRVNGPSIEVCS